ncbi:MAG: alanine--tRNA ligase [Candidatus Spechtbacterales bacterium]|nr:alanine--tRNA ligase [Candidatus Spechtbacterales bacterium]
MNSNDIRKKYLDFFKERGHEVIPSSSLLPENDPTTLFTGSGMQPLVPYLLGKEHPRGSKLTDSQKCFRAEDIEEVGDNRHTTFFEMLGNWSLGDYFKAEQLPWFFEFLTEVVGLDANKLYVTVFAGDKDNNIPRDTESVDIWKKLFDSKGIEAKDVENAGEKGMQGGRIFYYGADKNWWSRAGIPQNMPAGEPGGPDSEVFYDFGLEHDTAYGKVCHPNCDCGRFLEIGNSVFMEYIKNEDGTFSSLPKKNVDFGGGLERITAASNNNADVFSIDVLSGIIKALEERSGKNYSDESHQTSFRVIADHLRAAVFVIADGAYPSNTDAGYMTRRLLRRSVRHMDILGITENTLSELAGSVINNYKDAYPKLTKKQTEIEEQIQKEEKKFRNTLRNGLKEFKKLAKKGNISGEDAFVLFSTYGFPLDMTIELAKEKGLSVDKEGFEKEMQKHKELSKAGAEKKFKGGLADHSDMSVKYHTATHLLHQALRDVLGDHVHQTGSNITPERLRFDFSHTGKMTDEEIKKTEDIVNEKIKEGLPVYYRDISKEKAEKMGAIGLFEDTYGDTVRVYGIGADPAEASREEMYSLEYCGGPHVENTSELGHFKIVKEKSVSAGKRRIKAILE